MNNSDLDKLDNIKNFENNIFEQPLNDLEYYKTIGVESWLQETGPQFIRFSDRYERKDKGVLHSTEYSAIEYFNGDEKYYIEGKLITKEEWKKMKK